MALIDNVVHEQSTSTGTGNMTIGAINGRQRFSQAFSTGGSDTFYYSILNQSAQEWEIGTGSLSDANTLVRDTVLASSNSGSAVNFSAGTKDVLNGIPASDAMLKTDLGTGVATWLATPSSSNLAAAVTGETGSGALVFGTSPTISGPTFTGNVTLPSGIWNSSGNVGIGTASPGNPLDVLTSTGANTARFTRGTAVVTPSNSGAAVVGLGAIGYGHGVVGEAAGASAWSGIFEHTGTGNDTKVQLGGATYAATFMNGNVGIGTTSPSTTLHVNGPVRTASYTVATLPAAGTVGAGTRAYVTNATATTFASTVAGGGANAVPVYSDGTNWKIG